MADQPVLVVADDNPDILRLVAARMKKRGWEVVTATNGADALEVVRRIQPSAVVLDWMMPMVTGPEACDQLKADERTSAIPVVLLTAKASEGDITTGFARGADDYLTKPFDVDELDQTLRRLMTS